MREKRPVGVDEVDEAVLRDRAIPDIDWTVLPEGSLSSRFEAPSGSLAVVSLGDPNAPRVVLAPGVTGSKEDFSLLSPLLVEAGYYVQSFDMAGQYESADAGPAPRSGRHYDYELFVDDLLAFLESGSTPAHVLGYSFAGTVAQLAMLRRPELFASLALLGTPPLSGKAFRGVRTIGSLAYVVDGRTGAGLMIWGVVTNKNRVSQRRLDFVRMRFGFTRRTSVDDIIGMMNNAPELRAAVAAVEIPKLVATGDHDLWPVTLHSRFARDIGAELAVYRTGHSPCETTPHQLARDLLALYRRAEASAGEPEA
ncbi:alpha/beta fold hydrolase [Compostimonas suwonensis]|uniref:Pimeloyl-ACP methyl ester carboxylesterase n=1 Tax=Compostimonas suwonensis TaxID=1048394 RepID=A0A2M9BTY6_9MICO|nr:alpha/beta hydrolase [Compostimonas suwonensis]PJJ61403.1 pimeloyl-ACP methyl ester carboxylesterase [Compostimonas suwonensis]